jgi:type VI secretion system protein ImpK
MMLADDTPLHDDGRDKSDNGQSPQEADESAMATVKETPGRVAWCAEACLRELVSATRSSPGIVASAVPLITLAHRLRYESQQPDQKQFRAAVTQAVTRYAHALEEARTDAEQARIAHYILCATIDDVVLSLPWGQESGWAQTGLVSTFHLSVTGGARVFEYLDSLQADPVTNGDLLLLTYYCLALAFEGRTRVIADGPLQLVQIRHSLYKILTRHHESPAGELSPHWQGAQVPHRFSPRRGLVWSALAVAALCLSSYFVFSVLTDRSSEQLRVALAAIPIGETASIVVSPPPQPLAEAVTLVAPPPRVVQETDPVEDLRALLQPELDKKLISLVGAGERLIIRINDVGLFASGSTRINPQFNALLQRIGSALAAGRFHALVVGNTDSLPTRRGKFPSNLELSQARARAVADTLVMYTDAETVATEGHADRDPLADNRTVEGRRMNRRIDIHIFSGRRAGHTGSAVSQPSRQQVTEGASK